MWEKKKGHAWVRTGVGGKRQQLGLMSLLPEVSLCSSFRSGTTQAPRLTLSPSNSLFLSFLFLLYLFSPVDQFYADLAYSGSSLNVS